MKHHIASAALIIIALVLEMAGFSGGSSDLGLLLLGAGFACEAWFWIRAFRVKRARAAARIAAPV